MPDLCKRFASWCPYLKLKISTRQRSFNQILQAHWNLLNRFPLLLCFLLWMLKKVKDKNLRLVSSGRLHSKLSRIERRESFSRNNCPQVMLKGNKRWWCFSSSFGRKWMNRKLTLLNVTLKEVINSCNLQRTMEKSSNELYFKSKKEWRKL